MKVKAILAFLITLNITAAAFSHGTKYEIVKTGRIGIKAMYDSGEAISNADVLVFPPGETSASVTEKADSGGVFYFTPERAGTWTFQVRDGTGHGMRINLDIDESLSIAGDTVPGSGLSLAQKILMALSIVWGAIGTAFYFKGKKG
jgi:nickel transport protein